MKTTTDYQQAKRRLKQIAIECRSMLKHDKPQWRMVINDNCDSLCKEYRFSEHKRNLLENYSCELHPKD